MAVLVVVAEQRLKHGPGLSEDCDVYGVVGHQALQLCLIEAHVAGDDVGRYRVGVDEVRGEGVWVAELVAAGLHGQRHRDVVALGEAKEQVLHGGAGRFVGLEEGDIGVLGFQAPEGEGTEAGAAEVKGLYGPGEKKREALLMPKEGMRLK